jgi:hypothetical protein
VQPAPKVECPGELRLLALVIPYLHTLKGIFCLVISKFTVQYQLFRTRRPLYLILHTNYHMRAPHAILIPPSSLSPSPTYPTPSSSTASSSLLYSFQWRPAPLPSIAGAPAPPSGGPTARARGSGVGARGGRRRTRRGGRRWCGGRIRHDGKPPLLCLSALQRGRAPPPATPVEATTSSPAPLRSRIRSWRQCGDLVRAQGRLGVGGAGGGGAPARAAYGGSSSSAQHSLPQRIPRDAWRWALRWSWAARYGGAGAATEAGTEVEVEQGCRASEELGGGGQCWCIPYSWLSSAPRFPGGGNGGGHRGGARRRRTPPRLKLLFRRQDLFFRRAPSLPCFRLRACIDCPGRQVGSARGVAHAAYSGDPGAARDTQYVILPPDAGGKTVNVYWSAP